MTIQFDRVRCWGTHVWVSDGGSGRDAPFAEIVDLEFDTIYDLNRVLSRSFEGDLAP